MIKIAKSAKASLVLLSKKYISKSFFKKMKNIISTLYIVSLLYISQQVE